ncbi:hypothetical protein E3N88_07892 [Mikania micrantha]|uniref:Uncharacterized protein n=1 Tax=Mikania micrantha TaxID=192012 RepID=A0A5N6PFR8_9ASTR|nr:hypothetical protein E3N88_07892 [Mikania micrantha]
MEESAQRRERLKAMRMEASQEDATFNTDHSAVNLSNPLIESTTNSQITSQSFNYYTNPMAAYSGNKRSQVSPQMTQDYSSTPQRPRTNKTLPSPSLQPHINELPNPQMQQPPGHYANPNYSSNPPRSSNLPSPSWTGNGPQSRSYCGPGGIDFPILKTHFTSGSGQPGYPSPHFTNSPGHGSGRGYPSPEPNFSNSPSHGSGQGGYPSSGPNQGRGYGLGFKNNMTSGPSSGRGRGRGRGRGLGHNHLSAEDRPDRFFNTSMLEDPWKFLEPVIWKPLKKQWNPYSHRAKVSESPRQSSLAEVLAASFNEASNNAE